MSILIQPATSPLRSRPELIAALEAFLQHLQESAEDGDLEGALERVTGKYGDFEGRLYPRMGGSAAIPITVIPAPSRSGAPLPCSPIVVAVVAREDDDVVARRVFVIRRDGPEGELLATPARHDDDDE